MRRFRIIAIVTSLAAMICGCSNTSTNSHEKPRRSNPPVEASRAAGGTLTVEIDGHPVTLEVADELHERRAGLSERNSLEADHGMIFVYRDAAVRSFWMQGCKIGLDIAYVDESGEIFQIGSLDPPALAKGEVRSLESTRAALFVIELEKGWFAAHRVAAGTRISVDDALRRLTRSAAP